VNWGQAGAISEFNGTSERLLFHAYLDSSPTGRSVQSYRGFRANWTGSPAEEPSIVALGDSSRGQVTIYVSWNGDTEAKLWKFYLEDIPNKRRKTLLGKVKRTSFETSFTFPSHERGSVFAEAIDVKGNILASTNIVSPQERVKIQKVLAMTGDGVDQNMMAEKLEF
jgi:hypothetical protein